MWCGIGKSSFSIATACLVTATVVISNTANAVRQRDYTPQQFRSVLRGLGYNVKVSSEPLTNADAKKAIQEFQTGYRLKPVDGLAGPKTQDFAAEIIQILQANLNLVMKPNPPLPRSQYYTPRTEAVVRSFQKKFQLEETGIADLALRQKLDAEAKSILGGNESTPTETPTPEATPTETPTPEVTPTETPTPEATPTETPTPEATPTETPTPEATPTPTVTPRTPAPKPNR
ncbi:MAG: peptidoglycan-binding protein [Calothrix sp. C42_A2020_038]|nr:peptidoglycan-binding protein [Calothrix sp. C42_A2020_038]